MMIKTLAIIPARGGSKRIPRKNIKLFIDKPIMAYSIELALKTGLFTEVMVSTEDEEIAQVAKKYGASIPFFRSHENADDYTSTQDVLKEVISQYSKRLGQKFDKICCIYPTAPLIRERHLIAGFEKLMDSDFDTVFPVVQFGYPIWRGLVFDELKKIKMCWPEYLNSRSQDLKTIYHDAGQWYWINAENILNTLFTDNSSSIILDESEVQDIDTLTDWKLAEIKYKVMNTIF